MARRAMPQARCQYTGGVPMGSADRHTFLDSEGSPLEARIQSALRDLRLRFPKRFPQLDDDVFVTDVFEEAGCRIVAHEAEHGQVDNLEAFAWTTVLNVARSRLARSSMRVVGSTLDPAASDAVLRQLHARNGTREQIENDILVQQILAHLSPEERTCATGRHGDTPLRDRSCLRKVRGVRKHARLSDESEDSRLVALNEDGGARESREAANEAPERCECVTADEAQSKR